MKKFYILFFTLLLPCIMLSCGSPRNESNEASSFDSPDSLTEEFEKTDSTESESSENDLSSTNFNYLNDCDVLYSSDENYVIYTNDDKSGYYYRVYDNKGVIIDYGYSSWRGSISFSNKGNLLVLTDAAGGSQYNQKFYDTSTGNTSRLFYKPVCVYGRQIAYFDASNIDNIVLIVQDVFDADVFYHEIKRDFSDFVIKDQCEGRFINDGKSLEISYWISPTDEEVTEVIDIK